ncbi:MAG: MBL fold metallo-hydrolase [Lachnospiraceae bacterium]|nr:MBL fold metallo-hydrolase [Lachnospiraceae bacterium]
MKLTFLGATHEVTGSCYYLEACGKKILVDYGMEQGQDLYENAPMPVPASQIDMVLLTHAHMDHSGLLPLLCKEGFQGQIFSTGGTASLCRIMLLDSAHIQEFEAEWKNRKAERAGRPKVEPLYSRIDAENAIKCFVGVEYEQEKIVAEGIIVRFVDAGHLLGSSSIEVTITENGVTKKIIFSGDIGNTNQPLISDPVYLKGADYVVMESTYGDRTHERPEHADYAGALADVIQRTFDRGGNVVIPSFAVGRTQEMLYFIRQIKQEGLVQGHDGFQVWVDSPLAIEATNIFRERMHDDFDKEAMELLREGINPIGFDGLKVAVTSDESKAINEDKQPKIIISASGMCDAGRIKHHLKHNLWREESTILFVGYQAVGTPGRSILDGTDSVKLFGEEIEVRAEICQLPGVSGHADDEGLMAWIKAMEEKPKMVFVTHGEDKVTEFFRDRLINELGLNAYAPFSGTRFDLASGTFEVEAEPVPIEKEEAQARQAVRQDGGSQVRPVAKGEDGLKRISSKNKKAIHAYARLTAAGERLLAVIRHNEGGANKDINKLTEEILRLCDKWDR